MKTLFLLIFLLIAIAIISVVGWYYRAGLKIVADTLISPYQPLVQKVKPPVSSPKPLPPPDWEKINVSSFGLNLNIPADWVFDKNAAVIKSTYGGNSVSISVNSGVLVPTTYNQDLFNKINNLKAGSEFEHQHLDEKIKFKKIESGKILTGQPYVIFIWDQKNTQTEASVFGVRGFILKDTSLIIFTPNKINDESTELLNKIMSFSSLN